MPRSKTRKRSAPNQRKAAPPATGTFQQRVFALTEASVMLVKELEDSSTNPGSIGLTPEQFQDMHVTLRASSLGMLSLYAAVSGNPDPRAIIEKGKLP